MSEQIKDFLDAYDFQKWAKVNLGAQDFSGTDWDGMNLSGEELPRQWKYNNAEIEKYWHCWRCARDGYIPNPNSTEAA